jgi:hypothetical protein
MQDGCGAGSALERDCDAEHCEATDCFAGHSSGMPFVSVPGNGEVRGKEHGTIECREKAGFGVAGAFCVLNFPAAADTFRCFGFLRGEFRHSGTTLHAARICGVGL